MNQTVAKTWALYEAGKEYNRGLGLYETVRRNDRFYRGDHWKDVHADLPKPIFNYVRRITDYLVETVAPGTLSILYSDDRLPFLRNESVKKAVINGIDILNRHAEYRWKRTGMERLVQEALLSAALSGDGIFYVYWNAEKTDGQFFSGDVCTELIQTENFFVADVNNRDLQSQKYLLLAGRSTVNALREEAISCGLSRKEAEKIVGDADTELSFDDASSLEMRGAEKATYLLYFYKKDGEVVFEKSTKDCLIKRVFTGLKYYPMAMFNWQTSKNSFHGSAPVSDMIANQKYINTAYAMMMKHMSDTAFSKVIYDKSRIPEWSNQVGEAIAAVGGGNVSDAVSVLGVGNMQDGYLDLINNVIENTKSVMGATEVSLGDGKATNTSAILALQQASKSALNHVTVNLCKCVGELATVWADMLCTYCPKERFLAITGEDGVSAKAPDYPLLKRELLRASAEVGSTNRYAPSSTVAILDKLLEGGYLDVRAYLELLPPGTVSDRDSVLNKINPKGALQNG